MKTDTRRITYEPTKQANDFIVAVQTAVMRKTGRAVGISPIISALVEAMSQDKQADLVAIVQAHAAKVKNGAAPPAP